MNENERRRTTARQMRLAQLPSEQRAALRGDETRAGQQNHPGEGYGLLWVPDGPREALQRSIERRH